MPRDPAKAAALKERIRAAFADASYPGDDNIAAGSSFEAQDVQEFFKGKHWEEITLHSLRHDYQGDPSACLNMMTPEAFRYYLPTYLFIAIDGQPESDVLPEFTVYALTPSEERKGHSHNWFMQRVSVFNQAQRAAIKAFLESQPSLYEGKRDYGCAPTEEAIQFWSD